MEASDFDRGYTAGDCQGWYEGHEEGFKDGYNACLNSEPRFGTWISVNDKKPKVEEDVLLLVKEIEINNSGEAVGTFYHVFTGTWGGGAWSTNYCFGNKYIFEVNKEKGANVVFVTHWMPQPEKPKGGYYNQPKEE